MFIKTLRTLKNSGDRKGDVLKVTSNKTNEAFLIMTRMKGMNVSVIITDPEKNFKFETIARCSKEEYCGETE